MERRRQREAQEILAEASAVLGRSLDLRETARAIAHAPLPLFADWAVLDVLDDAGRLTRMALAHVDSASVEAAEALDRRWPPDFDAPSGPPRVARTGEPELVSDVTVDDFAPFARDAEHLAAWRAFGVRSYMAVPLVAGDSTLGVLSLFSTDRGRRYTVEDLPLALELGQRAAAALMNARLFERERRAHEEAEAARSRIERLQHLSADLTRVLTRAKVTDVVVRHLVEGLGAYSGGVVELSDDGREFILLETVGLSEEVRRRFARFSADMPVPVRDVARTREAVFLENRAQWAARFEELPATLPPNLEGAWAALPLLVEEQGEERLLGALTCTVRGPRSFSDEERRFMRAFADLCAQALERARLYEAEYTARGRAEALQQLTARLARARTMADVGRTFSRELTTLVGADTAWVGAVTSDGTAIEALGWTGYPDEAAAVWRRLPLDARTMLTDAMQAGRPHWWSTREALIAAYPERESIIRASGQESAAVLPLVEEDAAGSEFGGVGVIGAIVIGFRELYRFDRDTQSFFLALAQQCAQAIVRARASEAECSARREADAARVRAERLQSLTSALARAVTAEAVIEAAVVEGGEAVGSVSGVLALLDSEGETFTLVPGPGMPRDLGDVWRRFPKDRRTSAAEAVRTLQPVYSRTRAEFAARGPENAVLAERLQLGANAALPLVVAEGGGGEREQVLGVLAFTFAEPRTFGPAEDAFLRAVADQCAQALERARLYNAEQRARAEAEAANQSKSQFLATMSHELRTPLNAIAGYAELLEMEIHGPIAPGQREALARIQRSQRHLLSLINEVLSFARVEAGVMSYEVCAVRVLDVVSTAESLIAPQVQARGLTLTVEVEDTTLTVRADAEKVGQVLLNLLSNAVKFSPRGGTITVRCHARQERHTPATGDGADSEALAGGPQFVDIAVTDEGGGIPIDQRERIFEPFVQVGRTLTSASEGTGLGLAISRELTRAMGGEITVHSTEGRGSTFTLSLLAAG